MAHCSDQPYATQNAVMLRESGASTLSASGALDKDGPPACAEGDDWLWGRNKYLRRIRTVLTVVLFSFLFTTPALAVQPDEILQDPALEARARAISAGLRCLVCQNQSIDDSDATVARDLRILIREQLMKNQSDEQVVAFVVDRYGDYVLLKPRLTAKTIILWFTPFLILLLGGFYLLRGRKPETPVHDQLSDTEKAELDAILRK